MKSAINQLLVVLILITLSTVRANAQDAQRSGVTVSGYQTPGDQIGQNVMLSYENGNDYTVKVTAEVKYRCGEHTLTLSDTADYLQAGKTSKSWVDNCSAESMELYQVRIISVEKE
jgi:hypothetical protein